MDICGRGTYSATHFGRVRLRTSSGRIFTSKTLSGESIGREEIDDGIWSVRYGPLLLARFDKRQMKFHG